MLGIGCLHEKQRHVESARRRSSDSISREGASIAVPSASRGRLNLSQGLLVLRAVADSVNLEAVLSKLKLGMNSGFHGGISERERIQAEIEIEKSTQ
jgi:hypothetical protein